MLERMDPQLREEYAAMQPFSIQYESLCAFRRDSLALYRQAPADFEARDDIRFSIQTIQSPFGCYPLQLRIYEPVQRSPTMPVILFFHGGGCILSSAEQEDPSCLELASAENSVVVSVDYRLAPEHPAPAGQMDCYAAWLWVCGEGADLLHLDLDRSVFYGGSAGGHMVIGTALRLLDEKKRLPSALLPLYPMLDNRGVTKSSQEITDSSLWGRDQNLQAWNYYVNGFSGRASVEADSYIIPASRDDFYGFPPVFTFVGELDQFRDETMDLVRKLCCCGVPVTFTLYPGCYHAFELYVPDADVSRQARRSFHEFIQKAFRVKL